jgi:hypothetical protein
MSSLATAVATTTKAATKKLIENESLQNISSRGETK